VKINQSSQSVVTNLQDDEWSLVNLRQTTATTATYRTATDKAVGRPSHVTAVITRVSFFQLILKMGSVTQRLKITGNATPYATKMGSLQQQHNSSNNHKTHTTCM